MSSVVLWSSSASPLILSIRVLLWATSNIEHFLIKQLVEDSIFFFLEFLVACDSELSCVSAGSIFSIDKSLEIFCSFSILDIRTRIFVSFYLLFKMTRSKTKNCILFFKDFNLKE